MKPSIQLPEKFLGRLQKQYPRDAEKILQTFYQRGPVIRVNTLLTTKSLFLQELKKNGVETDPVSLLPDAHSVTNADRRTLTGLDLYKKGFFYIQSAASQVPVAVLDPKPGEKILDLCAAPGSKTTQIAIKMKVTGELIANEPNKERFFKLLSNLKHQKLEHFVTPKMYPGQNYPNFYAEYFDRVLVDAPCSSESRFIEGDKKSYGYWSQPKVKALSKLQKKLLSSAIRCTKKGGVIVYSTCSLAPEENELVLQEILKKHPEVRLEDIKGRWKRLPILPEWNGKDIRPEIVKSLRIEPDDRYESFFIALLKKTKTVPENAQGNKLGISKKQKYTKSK